MKIHYEAPSDVQKYISKHRTITIEEKIPQFEGLLGPVRRFKDLTPETEILEVGTGSGWFPILCQLRGLRCKGLEISPQLIDMAKEIGRQQGVVPDIELGNLEDYQLPDNYYDVVMASSIFEHVEDWQTGIHKVYKTLKPGGLLYFESTNKFSFTSGEFKLIPLYGWLPNWLRYSLRKMIQGRDIMKLGIDFHQFTHRCLRNQFEKVGFSRILDRIEIADESQVSTELRRTIVRSARRFGLVRALALTFAEATRFVCIK
ncbi:MAG TPA: class I SAM-dependent methyltransferase [Chthoniobacterales bacterium]|nr:class I SAM-dependent methyltransferase [Chthoniobacterales bacterium]